MHVPIMFLLLCISGYDFPWPCTPLIGAYISTTMNIINSTPSHLTYSGLR